MLRRRRYAQFDNPSFKNQGQCVSYFEHQTKRAHDEQEHHSRMEHKKHGEEHGKHHG